MKWPDLTPPAEGVEVPLWRRLAWMGAIWGMSVGALFAVAWLLRLVIAP